jgi:ribonuclease T
MTEMSNRFRGFLPIVVDVETGGFDAKKDALLEVAMVTLVMDEQGLLYPAQTLHHHIIPFTGANCDPKSLAFNKIDPYHPFRFAKEEEAAFREMFHIIRLIKKQNKCSHAVLVGHNAWFDLSFIREAAERHKLKSPFHSFTSFDTATLGGLVYGQTVLGKALEAAGIRYQPKEAHSAIYDAQRTAELFCKIVNTYPY